MDKIFDYILILGGPIEEDKPSPLLCERIKKGAEVYAENEGTKIVVSGGIKGETQRLSEAQIMKNALLTLGVPEEDIILEEQAKTTLQNFQFTREMLGDAAKVAFVTSRFHIWRSKKIMKKAGVSYLPIASLNGEDSLGFRIREAFLRPLAFFGIIW